MKRVVLFALVFTGLQCYAQKEFEGTLHIEVLTADTSGIPKMNFEVKLKGSMARMDIHSTNIDDYSLIINYETGKSIMLKSHNGENIAVHGTKKINETGSFAVEKAELTKVAGYLCRKGKVTTASGSSEVFYSTAFKTKAQFFGAYTDVPGLVLELHLSKDGNDQVLRTNKLSKRKVKDEEFIVPKEFREMDESEYEMLLPLFPELMQ